MDNKRPVLFGTPLSKSLENEANCDDVSGRGGPASRRRARLERQQIATDDQGRRRFHGAFTGGFSAGHYNTEGTTQGFQPKSFVSKRGEQRGDQSTTGYNHRPEDYMDDEDFGEFGIAPKKIRLACGYSKETSDRVTSSGANIIRAPQGDSIGEKILRSMTGDRDGIGSENDLDDLVSVQKNDLHGLGYKPLSCPHSTLVPDDNNPLVATLKHGKRLKISGQAFGSGVLGDDDEFDADRANLHHMNEYGIDTMANYKFPSKSSEQRQQQQQRERVQNDSVQNYEDKDRDELDDFVLARDVESMDICGDGSSQYPRPVISADWKMPLREEPYVPPSEIECSQDLRALRRQAGEFSERFVGGSSTVTKCDFVGGPSGLLQFSDLKALRPDEPKRKANLPSTSEVSLTIKRQIVEWAPSNVLCKHFNVPNPYPDRVFFEIKPSQLTFNQLAAKDPSDDKAARDGAGRPAALELRRSIFNICSEEMARDADDENEQSDGDNGRNNDDSNDRVSDDERPQVIELTSDQEMEGRLAQTGDRESDQESDVVLVPAEKKEPEVINLLSSSSADESENSNDEDAYGPALPPTRQTLQAIDRSLGALSSSLSSLSALDLKGRRREKRRKKKKSKDKRPPREHQSVQAPSQTE